MDLFAFFIYKNEIPLPGGPGGPGLLWSERVLFFKFNGFIKTSLFS